MVLSQIAYIIENVFNEEDTSKMRRIVCKDGNLTPAGELSRKFVKPRLADIEKVCGQAMNVRYVAYLLEHYFRETQVSICPCGNPQCKST